jgi:hypothetical protein
MAALCCAAPHRNCAPAEEILIGGLHNSQEVGIGAEAPGIHVGWNNRKFGTGRAADSMDAIGSSCPSTTEDRVRQGASTTPSFKVTIPGLFDVSTIWGACCSIAITPDGIVMMRSSSRSCSHRS